MANWSPTYLIDYLPFRGLCAQVFVGLSHDTYDMNKCLLAAINICCFGYSDRVTVIIGYHLWIASINFGYYR